MWYNPSVGYPRRYLGISTFGDSPYFARVECGLGCGEVKPPPLTSSLAVVPRGSRLNCPFRWATRSRLELRVRSHAGRARNSQQYFEPPWRVLGIIYISNQCQCQKNFLENEQKLFLQTKERGKGRGRGCRDV